MSAADDPEVVEIMARAAHTIFRRGEDRWDLRHPKTKRLLVSETVREDFRNEARAAIRAIEGAGYRITRV